MGVCWYPDLSQTRGQLALIEWVDITGQQNVDFATQCQGMPAKTRKFLICRSGVRSAAAYMTLIENGYENVCNVAEGFEGDLDSHSHRGHLNGWKYHQLPWQQR